MPGEQFSSSHPPTPPTSEEDRFAWLRLLRCHRVGISTFFRLIDEFGTAQNALSALPEVARDAGMNGYKVCPRRVIDQELNTARAAKARLLCFGDDEYPAGLYDINNPPPLLWAIGDVSLTMRASIAMVGARNASSLGLRGAEKFARELGEAGYISVSGLARGIDAACHKASIQTGTIAVVGGGADVIYPMENEALTKAIRQSGLILSEQPMGMKPQARHFPMRNRIIAGLGQALLVIEAAAKSGSLITARDALDIGREVLAIPGHPVDPRAAGCNLLIRDGATLVRNATDVIEALAPISQIIEQAELPLAPPPVAPPALTDRHTLQAQILSRMGHAPIAESQLQNDLDMPPDHVSAALTELELDGTITRDAGGILRRTATLH